MAHFFLQIVNHHCKTSGLISEFLRNLQMFSELPKQMIYMRLLVMDPCSSKRRFLKPVINIFSSSLVASLVCLLSFDTPIWRFPELLQFQESYPTSKRDSLSGKLNVNFRRNLAILINDILWLLQKVCTQDIHWIAREVTRRTPWAMK